jgi:hypothetical protein
MANPSPFTVPALARSARARQKMSSSMASVSRPVKVFCWLGW